MSDSHAGAYEAALAPAGDGFAVAWHDERHGNAEVYFRLLDADGRPAGPERRLTQTPDDSYEPSLDRIGDGFAVAWYEQSDGGEQRAMLAGFRPDGTRMWESPFELGTRNPVIRADGSTIFCAWIQADLQGREAVWAGRWDARGQPVGNRVQLGPASKNTWNLNAALDGTGAWVVYDASAETRASEVYLTRLDASGVHLVRLTRDDGRESKYPDLALDSRGRAALTWFDVRDGNPEVYLFVGASADLSGELDSKAQRVSHTPGDSIAAYVAWSDGKVGLAWSDKGDGQQHEVFLQSFDDHGGPLGGALQLTHNETWSLVPAIRPWHSGFALAWNEYQPIQDRDHAGPSEVEVALVR